MKSIKILPHTADTKIKIEGSTLEDLFEAGLQGMNKIIKRQWVNIEDQEVNNKKEEVIKKINLTVSDATSLLLDFLSEVLICSQEEKAIFSKVLFDDLDERNIDAEIYGETVDEFNKDIKAVARREANVAKNEKGNWETVIVFDV